MNHGTALWKSNTAVEDFGRLQFAADGTLTLTSPSGSAELPLELSTSPFLDVYATPAWMCALGAAGGQLILGRASGPSLEVIAELDRLDCGERYDSGTHVVRFHDHPSYDQCVLAWEIGVALVHPLDGMAWKHMHGDANQRVIGITAEAIELMGVDKAVSIDLRDGAARERPVGNRR